MLEYFDDETENGKLYVNYPMIESLKYTKEMPDEKYHEYEVSRAVCAEHKFKGLAEAFAFAGAKQYRFIDLAKTPADEVRQNWELLKEQNVRKANHICNGKNVLPEKKEDIAQDKLFEAQKAKYVDMNDSVSILNSFPIFLFEYLR